MSPSNSSIEGRESTATQLSALRTSRLWWAIGLTLLQVNSLQGVTPEPYTRGLSFSLRLHGAPSVQSSASMDVTGQPGDGTGQVYAEFENIVDSGIGTAFLRPGKKYVVSVNGTESLGYQMSFIPPDDYDVYVDGSRTNLVSRSAGEFFSDSYEVEIRPVGVSGPVGAGSFSGFRIGQSITWSVGLGLRPGGHPVESISFREFDLSGSPASRSALYCDLVSVPVLWPSGMGVVRDGGSAQVLRQIKTPQVFVDLIDETSGYSMKFYAPGQATWNSGSQSYTVSDDPWKTIVVVPASSNSIKITETEGTVSRESILTLTSGSVSAGNQVWTLQEGSGSTWPRTTTYTSSVPSSGIREAVVVEKNASNVISAETKYRFESFAWGEELTEVKTNPNGGSNALTRTYVYHTSGSAPGNYRKVKSITEPDGQWVARDYYDDWDRLGQLSHEYFPWISSPATYSLSTSSGRVVTYDYSADWTGRKRLRSSVSEAVNGTQTGLTTTTSTNTSVQYIQSVLLDSSMFYASGLSLPGVVVNAVENRDSVPLEHMGQTLAVLRADKTQTSVRPYGYGSYNPTTHSFSSAGNTHWRQITFNGTSDTSGDLLSSYDTIGIVPIRLVAGKSTMDVTITTLGGLPVRTETYVYVGSGNFSSVPITFEDFTYDVAGRLTSRTANNGDSSSYTYTNGRLMSTTDGAGSVTEFTYDELGRVQDKIKVIPSPGQNIVTRYAYDASNRIISETVGHGQSETLVSTSAFDLSGRPTSVKPPGIDATTIGYSQSSRTRTTTAPAPSSATKIETYQLDGRLASITGTAVVANHFSYTIASGGGKTMQVTIGNSGSPRWTMSWMDWLGRVVLTGRPGFNSPALGNYYEDNTYSGTTGQLVRTGRTGLAPTRYEYDNHGAVIRSGLDIGDDGLDLDSADRITDSDRYFEIYSGSWWVRAETKVYPTDTTPHTDSLVRTRLTGFTSEVRAETQTTTTNGALITQAVSVNTSTKTVTTTTSQSGIGDHIETTVNGFPTTVTGSDGLTYTTGYDSLGRPVTSKDPLDRTTTTGYKPGSLLPEEVEDSVGMLASYTYDDAGRRIGQGEASDGNTADRFTYFAYNARGQLYRQWGHTSPPVEHGYDTNYGDHVSQKTYRGGTGWTGSTWPGSPGTADTVTWAYDAATGLLSSKTDALSHAVTFSYNLQGQTDERIADRGPLTTDKVTTTYTYDDATGALIAVDYDDDDTTPLVFRYDRMGHTYEVDDATGTRSFDRCPCGRVNSETFDSGFYGTRVLTHVHETGLSGEVVGRYKGFKLGSAIGSSADLEQVYSYTSGGRFDTLVSKRANNAYTRTFDYDYADNSHLVDSFTTSGSHSFTVAREYNAQRDLLESIDSKWNGATQSRFDYTHTKLMQRKTAKQSGAAFADYWTGTAYSAVYSVYSYNTRGELEGAAMYRGNTPSATPSASDELPGRRFEYRYDPMGNRTLTRGTAAATSADEDYVSNAANQYETKENNLVRFAGTAVGSANVAVAGVTTGTDKLDRAWGAMLVPLNTTSAVKGSVNVFAAIPGGGSGGADLLKTEARTFVAPERTQEFSYDYAGNLKSDGLWEYTYDAENRLISMQTHPDAIGTGMIANADARRLEFTYDYLGRRVQKTVKDGRNISTGEYATTPIKNDKYLYNGWNLIAEFSELPTLTLVRSYTWGLDLTGSLTATGGVGALLQIYDHVASKTYFPTYDGNGNVVTLLDADGGSGGLIAATYEHGPFGEAMRTEVNPTALTANPALAQQSFRFSTKFTDAETGLVYYGLRYYSATLGRFINRDPIEEAGGLNLYGFAGNDGVNRADLLGASGLIIDLFTSYSDKEEVVVLEPFGVSETRPRMMDTQRWNEMLRQLPGSPWHMDPRIPFFDRGLYDSMINAVLFSEWRRPLFKISNRRGQSPCDPNSEASETNWWREGTSIGVGFIPLAGTGQSLVELISGKDYITGDKSNRWLAAAGLVAGLFPAGKGLLKGGSRLLRAGDATGDALARPTLWRETQDAIEAAARRNEAGEFVDPNTGRELIDGFHYGHRYGRENRRLLLEGEIHDLSQEQLSKWVNSNPQWFQVEGIAENLSHAFEKGGSRLDWHRVIGHDALCNIGVGAGLNGLFQTSNVFTGP